MGALQIRNFCIIAHIDHGKSTLADRLLELTNTVEKRAMRSQLLDTMDLERERGITIKLQPVRMQYRLGDQDYILNLIDTPGHVDFSYEVSRSLAACEAALLVVDASQGIQAQTLANVYLAVEAGLTIIPVVNKIDLPQAQPDKVAREVAALVGGSPEDVISISAKTGKNVEEVLRKITERCPAPRVDINSPTRALIFDSLYDEHRGVVSYVRLVEGSIKKGDRLTIMGSKVQTEAQEVGWFSPKMSPAHRLSSGSIG